MNFTDRTSLGNTFARKLQKLRGKDAVVLCLQENSLLTCLTMASLLRAWVYPLIYAPVYTSDHAHKLLGAFDQDGEFCPLYYGPADEFEMTSEMSAAVKDQRVAALKSMRAQTASFGMQLDKQRLNGRNVILAADIIASPLPVLVAQRFLHNLSPKSLTAIAGNATPEAARLFRMSAAHTDILDVVSGNFADDSHYFEYADTYTPKQKQTLTQHIAAYWQ